MCDMARAPRVPKKPPREAPATSAISLRVTREELDAFHKAAEESGVSMTTWIRILLRRGAGLPTV